MGIRQKMKEWATEAFWDVLAEGFHRASHVVQPFFSKQPTLEPEFFQPKPLEQPKRPSVDTAQAIAHRVLDFNPYLSQVSILEVRVTKDVVDVSCFVKTDEPDDLRWLAASDEVSATIGHDFYFSYSEDNPQRCSFFTYTDNVDALLEALRLVNRELGASQA